MGLKKIYYAIASVIIILILLFVYNYLNTNMATPSQTKPYIAKESGKNTDKQKDVCEFINNSTFRSIKKYNIGMGPDGPVNGNYEIKFSNGKFEWLAGEVGGGNGTYLCNNNQILGSIGQTYSVIGAYNNETNILLWNKVEYKK